jgi:hypothetical protein
MAREQGRFAPVNHPSAAFAMPRFGPYSCPLPCLPPNTRNCATPSENFGQRADLFYLSGRCDFQQQTKRREQ